MEDIYNYRDTVDYSQENASQHYDDNMDGDQERPDRGSDERRMQESLSDARFVGCEALALRLCAGRPGQDGALPAVGLPGRQSNE